MSNVIQKNNIITKKQRQPWIDVFIDGHLYFLKGKF